MRLGSGAAARFLHRSRRQGLNFRYSGRCKHRQHLRFGFGYYRHIGDDGRFNLPGIGFDIPIRGILGIQFRVGSIGLKEFAGINQRILSTNGF